MSQTRDRRTRKLQRRESVTGKSIKACDDFKSNIWRPTKCVHCFFSASEHAKSSSSSREINPYELKKLDDLYQAGMIQEAEYTQRRDSLSSNPPSTSVGPTSSSSSPITQPGQYMESNISSKKAKQTVHHPLAPINLSELGAELPLPESPFNPPATSSTSPSPPAEPIEIEINEADVADDILEGIIVCFFADGSVRYNEMTAFAVRTFIDATPRIRVGLLTKDTHTSQAIIGTLASSQRHRVIPKLVSSTPHFEKWNPTQYKLDIAQYADAFESIFWFDSDTITFGDMTEFLGSFASSDANFYFTPDHVNGDAKFCENWSENIGKLCPIPQACLMGFKSEIIQDFFGVWEAIWKHWITPAPFVNFPDPNPTFEGSAFCIEQYALGQALSTHGKWMNSAMWFKRTFIAVPRSGITPVDTLPKRAVSVSPITKIIAAHPDALLDLRELRSIRIPPKTVTKRSHSFLTSTHFDYIDRFANMYHCYNHSYDRVKKWYQLYTAYGPSLAPQ